jgi:hypothetical protein|nr:MAG TPA: hypothetical protein [Caudoviricetes sp.]
MRLKLTIKTQSVSDIITNSSSETFLRIGTNDEEYHQIIYNILKNLFPSTDSEMGITVWDVDSEEGDEYSYQIHINVPYGVEDFETFLKEGVEAILKDRIGDEGYVIEDIS